jgi:hypothetical protein
MTPAKTQTTATAHGGKRQQEVTSAGEEALRAEIARLKADNERLAKTKSGGTISFRVSEKGALSAYGLGRFPVTLYREQWTRLLAEKDRLLAFVEANSAALKLKDRS